MSLSAVDRLLQDATSHRKSADDSSAGYGSHKVDYVLQVTGMCAITSRQEEAG